MLGPVASSGVFLVKSVTSQNPPADQQTLWNAYLAAFIAGDLIPIKDYGDLLSPTLGQACWPYSAGHLQRAPGRGDLLPQAPSPPVDNPKRRDCEGAIKGLLTATRNVVSICDR